MTSPAIAPTIPSEIAPMQPSAPAAARRARKLRMSLAVRVGGFAPPQPPVGELQNRWYLRVSPYAGTVGSSVRRE